ncbi:MAG TPA: FAD-dependent oxidoreductase [Nitrospinota bacterium]|nr:FAD-dependent oxidoreductase [Nitrospinota bacterium]
MRKNTKYIVIGNGIAGISAIEGIRNRDTQCNITVISQEPFLAYSPTSLPYLIEGKITEDKIFIRNKEFYKKNRARLILNKRALGINPFNKEVFLSGGKNLTYDSLLIATGAEPIIPNLYGLSRCDYFVLKTLKDARRLKNEVLVNGHVVMSGGGLIGIELAYILRSQGFEVTVIEEKERILSFYFDDEAEKIIRDIYRKNGVNFILNSKLVGGERKKENRLILKLQNGNKIRTDLFIISVGMKPAVDFLKNSNIRVNKGIIVDRMMRTNYNNIFAAGDVTEARDFFSKKKVLSHIIPSAIYQGRIAGLNMAGGNETYSGNISMNIFSFFGNEALSIGDVFVNGRNIKIVKKVQTSKNRFYKLVLKDNCLIGAVLINVNIKPGILLNLIKRRIDLSPWLESVGTGFFNFGKVFQKAIGKMD